MSDRFETIFDVEVKEAEAPILAQCVCERLLAEQVIAYPSGATQANQSGESALAEVYLPGLGWWSPRAPSEASSTSKTRTSNRTRRRVNPIRSHTS